MKFPLASLFYFLGSLVFFAGALSYVININNPVGVYLYFVCACCYFTASTIQLGCDLRSKKRNDAKRRQISTTT